MCTLLRRLFWRINTQNHQQRLDGIKAEIKQLDDDLEDAISHHNDAIAQLLESKSGLSRTLLEVRGLAKP